MAGNTRGKRPQETVELTEVLILHGDTFDGSDREKEAKLERIREALRAREIDFIDQPDALELWLNVGARDQAITALQEMGYRTDVYEV